MYWVWVHRVSSFPSTFCLHFTEFFWSLFAWQFFKRTKNIQNDFLWKRTQMITSSVTAASKSNFISILTHKVKQLDAQNYLIKKKGTLTTCQRLSWLSLHSNHSDNMCLLFSLLMRGVFIFYFSHSRGKTYLWPPSLRRLISCTSLTLRWLRGSHYTAKQAAPRSCCCPSHSTRHDTTRVPRCLAMHTHCQSVKVFLLSITLLPPHPSISPLSPSNSMSPLQEISLNLCL